MSTLRVLASPRVWVSIIGAVVALALLFFAYLAAVANPQENLKDLPVVPVNEDRGGSLAGEPVDLGNQVVERVTAPDSPAAGTVEWTRLTSREEALEGLGRNEYYGAIVIPEDYTQRISSIARPLNISIAVINEDTGAEMGGQQVNLGDEVLKRITAPDSWAPDLVKWTQPGSRGAALDELSRGEAYAAVVIPKDYSERLASMSGPPPGSEPPKPESANLELLTSPAVRPATTGTINNAFTGIVGGVSKATSQRMLAGIGEQGVPVPPQAAPVISDSVRGEVSEAGVSTEAGPPPKTPKPAEIEVLANPSAGQGASGPVQNISMGIVQGTSAAGARRGGARSLHPMSRPWSETRSGLRSRKPSRSARTPPTASRPFSSPFWQTWRGSPGRRRSSSVSQPRLKGSFHVERTLRAQDYGLSGCCSAFCTPRSSAQPNSGSPSA